MRDAKFRHPKRMSHRFKNYIYTLEKIKQIHNPQSTLNHLSGSIWNVHGKTRQAKSDSNFLELHWLVRSQDGAYLLQQGGGPQRNLLPGIRRDPCKKLESPKS